MNADIFFTPHYTLPFNLPCPAISTVHDLIHLRFRSKGGMIGRTYARFMIGHSCRSSKFVLTNSENSRRDIESFFPRQARKVRVVYPAVDRDVFRRRDDTAIARFRKEMELDEDFALYVGSLKNHKNPRALVEIANVSGYPVVIASGDRDIFYRKLYPLVKTGAKMRLIEIRNENQLALLYSSARILVHPSLYEGFGLPPLEAMACGLPVVCSNASSLPEAAGDAALYFNPDDYRELVEKVKPCWHDDRLRRILIDKGYQRARYFDWARSATRIFELFLEAAKR